VKKARGLHVQQIIRRLLIFDPLEPPLNTTPFTLPSRAGTLATLLFALGVLALPAEILAQDVDLSGKWALTVESPNGTGQRELTLVQTGNELTGEIISSRADGELTGTVDGNEITFVAVVYMESGSFDITYHGTISGDEMKGTVDFGDYGSGTFTGKRVET
jgi:hypothetical protein